MGRTNFINRGLIALVAIGSIGLISPPIGDSTVSPSSRLAIQSPVPDKERTPERSASVRKDYGPSIIKAKFDKTDYGMTMDQIEQIYDRQLVTLDKPIKYTKLDLAQFGEDLEIRDISSFDPKEFIGNKLGSSAYISDVDKNGKKDVVLVNNTNYYGDEREVRATKKRNKWDPSWTDVTEGKDSQGRTVVYRKLAFIPTEEFSDSGDREHLFVRTSIKVLYDAAASN